MENSRLKVMMYPWLAMGHLTSYIHISNKLAERGYTILFLLPPKSQPKLEQFNHHPQLITFIPLTIPQLEGLPPETQTTADVPVHLHKLLRRAMDLTQPAILQPHLIFFDFTPWLPALARRFNVKSVHYCTISPAAVAYMIREEASADAFLDPLPGFPSSSPIKLSKHEACALHEVNNGREFDGATTLVQRMLACLNECDGLGFKSCREIEGKYCEFVERKFKKPVLLAGVVVGGAGAGAGAEGVDEEKWRTWLGEFEAKSVVYCSLGSEARLSKKQFEEVVLALELSGFPEGGAVGSSRRVVVDEWVQQRMILARFGGVLGSVWEGMVSECGMRGIR